MTSWQRHMVKDFAQNFLNYKLNMKNGSKKLILLKKELDSDFSIFYPHFCISVESLMTKLQLLKN